MTAPAATAMPNPMEKYLLSTTRRRLATLGLALCALATALPVRAEGQLRIAEQFGIVYLLLNVAQDQGLIQKHGKAQGVDIKVEFVKLSGGAAVNEALLSGSIEVAGAGVGPLLTIWDRTAGRMSLWPTSTLVRLFSTNCANCAGTGGCSAVIR